LERSRAGARRTALVWGFPLRALKVGFAWDAATNQGRTLYRCPPCGMLFNTGEYETPQYAALQQALRDPQSAYR
jgi:hypothetical protein